MAEQRVRGGSVPRRWSLVLALGVPILVLLGIAVGYHRLVYFERVAALHVPAGARFATRIDLEQVVLFEPVRKNLLPVLDAASASVNGQSLSQRITATTGINLAMDLREILFAVGQQEDQWLVVLSGLFPKDVLPAVATAIVQDARLVAVPRGDGVLRLDPLAMFMTQAADGAFLISNQEALLRASVLPTQTFHSLGLSPEGAGSVAAVLSDDAWLPLAALARVRAEVALGATVRLRVEAEPSAAALARGDEPGQWLTGAKLLASAGASDDRVWRALRPGLARADRVGNAENDWVFQTFFERHEFDTLVSDLATRLRRRLQQPVSPEQ